MEISSRHIQSRATVNNLKTMLKFKEKKEKKIGSFKILNKISFLEGGFFAFERQVSWGEQFTIWEDLM